MGATDLEFYALLGIVAFFTILIGSIMGFVSYSKISRLEIEVKKLTRLLARDRADNVPIEKARPVRAATATPAKIVQDEKPKPVNKPTKPAKPLARTRPKPEPRKKPTKPRRSFEEELGARWAVWVGGLALFLGAVFLLRYTIEAGFFTPIMRVGLAGLFGAGLLGAGEFLRRADTTGKNAKIMQTDLAKSLSQNADIPGVLTAVGIFALLGAVYAAYALYGLIGAIPAFGLMGLISLAALALGLIHGPKLAALGLVASLATPQLVQSDPPNAYNLYIYLTIIGAAALALAHKRKWGWLNICTLFGLLGWSFLSLAATKATGTHLAWLVFLGLIYAASTYISNGAERPGSKQALSAKTYDPNWASIWGVGAALALFFSADINRFAMPHFIAGMAGAGVLMGMSWFRPRQSFDVLSGGVLGVLLILSTIALDQTQTILATALLSTAIIGLCYTRLSQNVDRLADRLSEFLWPIAAIALPVVLCLGLYADRLNGEPGLIAGMFIALALVFAVLTYLRWNADLQKIIPISIFAAGTAIVYTLATLISFDGLPVSIGLMLGIVLAAASARKIPIKVMTMIAAGFALLTAAHVLFVQVPDVSAVSERIIFNELWIYFAVPAVICWFAAKDLGRREQNLYTEGLKAMAMVFAALFAVFQIRHAMNGGILLADRFSLEEMSMQVLVGLCFTLGGAFLRPQKIYSKAPVYENFIPTLAMGVSLVTLALFALGVCFAKAPLFSLGTPIKGGMILNSLLLAYLLPAVLLAAIAAMSRDKRPKPYVQLAAGLSLISIIHYVTGMIRHGFSGDYISIFKNFPDNAELYSISAAWLALGIALLVLGIKSKRQDVRLASAIVIMITVFKAFFVDMASLEGVLRAVSFVILGLVLIVIGRVYQRLLFSK